MSKTDAVAIQEKEEKTVYKVGEGKIPVIVVFRLQTIPGLERAKLQEWLKEKLGLSKHGKVSLNIDTSPPFRTIVSVIDGGVGINIGHLLSLEQIKHTDFSDRLDRALENLPPEQEVQLHASSFIVLDTLAKVFEEFGPNRCQAILEKFENTPKASILII